jgi:anhydro-N-acetylmuramic acid kinase
LAQRKRDIIGLMSGTSADGIDAVLCAIRGRGLSMRPRVVAHVYKPYPRAMRDGLLAVAGGTSATAHELCRLNWAIGALQADAAEAVLHAADFRPADIACIGMHGQTIAHLPPGAMGRGGRRGGATSRRGPSRSRAAVGTWQIGEPTVVAHRLGIPVVSRFREADMAVGGQGAPLVPWTDYVLFHHARRSRVVLNLGGIANATFLAPGCDAEEIAACDIGPANMVIDALVARVTQGRQSFDRNGAMARRGTVHAPLLKHWLGHPHFKRRAPKSCGREEFGETFVETARRRFSSAVSPDDFIATATRLTAVSVGNEVRAFADSRLGRPGVDELIICGGGARNATLLAELRQHVPAQRITTIDEHGIAAEQKEALSFAMLAAAHLDGVPANVTSVTGAREAVVLGQWTPATPSRGVQPLRTRE